MRPKSIWQWGHFVNLVSILRGLFNKLTLCVNETEELVPNFDELRRQLTLMRPVGEYVHTTSVWVRKYI